MTTTKKNRRYATVMHPTIAAVLAGTYRFPSEAQARQQLQILREHFVLSKHQTGESQENNILLWVKGYDVTPAEKENGWTGNYCAIGIKKRSDGKFSLEGKKVESELKYHPQRQRPNHKHPNWGHPILRSVKKKRIYPTVEAAQAELQLLHEEYPEVTIPLTNKLYLIIYSRQQTPPAQKFVLEIKVDDEGGFYIDSYVNDYKGKVPGMPEKAATGGVKAVKEEKPADAAGGYFTSMIALKRARKKTPGRPVTRPASGDGVEEDDKHDADA